MELLTHPLINVCFLLFISNFIIYFLLKYKIKELENTIIVLKETKEKEQPSLELTEFLNDQARYGFSFVRIDPKNVMLRSPKNMREN